MYRKFYGFNLEPFHITPDPRFFFLSPSHREALAAIAYGVKSRKGFIAVTAEVGLGKTTVVRTFLEKYGGNKVKTILVFNANITFANLIQLIFAELGLKPISTEVFQQIQQLHQHLIDLYQLDLTVVLIIDEAQNMPVKTLENLRMLSNLETTREKLLQIILVGQPELDAILKRTELRQLQQRLAVRAKLQPLTPEESALYVQYRLKKAGGSLKETFTRGALKQVIAYADGIPRKINIVCDNSLISGYGAERRPVGEDLVREAVADLEGKGWKKNLPWMVVPLLLGALVAVIMVYSFAGYPYLPAVKNRLHQVQEAVSSYLGQEKGEEVPGKKEAGHQGEGQLQDYEKKIIETGEASSSGSREDVATAEPMAEQEQEVFRVVAKSLDKSPAKSPGDGIDEPVGEVSGEAASEDRVPTAVQPLADDVETRDLLPPGAPVSVAPATGAVAEKILVEKPLPAPSSQPATALEKYPWPAALQAQMAAAVPIFPKLSPVRRQVLLEMADELGIEGLLSFRRMLAALEKEDYDEAARQILYSEWARRLQFRTFRLAVMMKDGK